MAKKDEVKKDEAQSSPENGSSGVVTQETTPERTVVEAREEARNASKQEGLESLTVLANRHRVPSWQQAALLRFAGWTDDKLVTDAEYAKALEGLKNRRIGGGRR